MRIGLIVAVAIVVLGGGAWIYFGRNSSPTTNTTTNTPTNTAPTNTASARTIAELQADGEPVTCTFVINDPNGDQQWSMFAADGKVRGDYTVATTGSNPWDGHIIRDATDGYMWGQHQGQTSAVKVKITAVTNANYNANANVASLDVDRSIVMDCDAWIADQSKFTPPSDVTFMDLSATLEANPVLTGVAKAAACEACNQSTDASQIETCRVALGC